MRCLVSFCYVMFLKNVYSTFNGKLYFQRYKRKNVKMLKKYDGNGNMIVHISIFVKDCSWNENRTKK